MFYYIIVNISNCLRDDRFEFGKKINKNLKISRIYVI